MIYLKVAEMETISELLRENCTREDILLSSEQLSSFEEYYSILLDWNSRVNLTSITEPNDVVNKHFIDSLLLSKAIDIPLSAKLADVGTGAGFPGVPLKILRPDIQITLIDSLGKRTKFLEYLTSSLKIDANILNIRGEEAGRISKLRESFDLSVSRAVAKLSIISEYCIPLIKKGGVFAAMKGPSVAEELNTNAPELLGCNPPEIKKFTLPDNEKSERTILLFIKSRKTPETYPRSNSKILKSPL
jgi:16S rRNA (guanine527-N7)-methyltransferase